MPRQKRAAVCWEKLRRGALLAPIEAATNDRFEKHVIRARCQNHAEFDPYRVGAKPPMPRTAVTTVRSGMDKWQLPALRVLSTFRLVLALALTLHLLGLRSSAQPQDQSDATPDASSVTKAQATPQGRNKMQSSAQLVTLLQRESLVFPNLATSTAPMSPEQKFKLFVNNSVSLSAFVAANLSAGVNQVHDAPVVYNEGIGGYGQRLGAARARRSSSQLFGTFLLASGLHQDPRFFVRNDLNLRGSVKYAIRRVFVTRGDSGNREFNWSGLLGMMGAEGLANVYYPDNYRTAGNTFSRFGYDLLGNAGGNLLRQYWPRINHKLKLVQQPTASGTSSGANRP